MFLKNKTTSSILSPNQLHHLKNHFLLFATYCLIFLQLQTAIEGARSIAQSFFSFNQNLSILPKTKPNSAQNASSLFCAFGLKTTRAWVCNAPLANPFWLKTSHWLVFLTPEPFKNNNRGTFDTKVINTNIAAGVANDLNNQAIEIQTGNQNYVEYNKNSIENPPPALASYLNALNDNQTLYNPIEETHKHWDETTRGMTGVSMVLIAVAMVALVAVTAGAAIGAAGAAAGAATATAAGAAVGVTATAAVVSTAATIGSAMLTAGAITLATTAATSAVNASMNDSGNFFSSLDDVGKITLKQTTSKETMQNVAVSMAAAGITAGATSVLTPAATVTNSTTLVNPLAAYAPAASNASTLGTQLANGFRDAAINTIANSAAQSAVNGDSFTDSLKNSAQNILINAVGQVAANQIGTLAHNGDINTATQLTLHAGLGCAMGAASGGGSGGCASGAAAGVVGELAGKALNNGQRDRETISQIAGLTGAGAALLTSIATGQDDQTTANNIFSGQMIGSNAARNNELMDHESLSPKELEKSGKAAGKGIAENPQESLDFALNVVDLGSSMANPPLAIGKWFGKKLIVEGAKQVGGTSSLSSGTDLILHPFSEGATHITTSNTINDYTQLGSQTYGDPNTGLYVIPKNQADQLLNGNYSRPQIEQALGLDAGDLRGGDLVRIDIPDPFNRNLRMPDPNTGNIFHQPNTGLTTGGFNESVINAPLKNDPLIIRK